MKILVIDDDYSVIEPVILLLESENYSVTWAKNGKEALKKAQKRYFNSDRVKEMLKKRYQDNKEEYKLLSKLNYYKKLSPNLTDKMLERAKDYMEELIYFYEEMIENGKEQYKNRINYAKNRFPEVPKLKQSKKVSRNSYNLIYILCFCKKDMI